jgi:asparagine synthase (glutamine-hydrolysing)
MQIFLLQYGHLSYRMESWASHGATLGLTYTYPLLDRRLVEFALSIPNHLFFKNGWKRYLYRTAMQGILPESLCWQKTKEDTAMMQGSRASYKAAESGQRSELLARADNPYLDVEKLQAAIDAEQGKREAVLDGNQSAPERRQLILEMTARRSRWLAFINPQVRFQA